MSASEPEKSRVDRIKDRVRGVLPRFWLTNDILAFVVVLAFIAYVFAPMTPYVDGYPEVNAMVLGAFVAAFGIIIAWAFGTDAVMAWRESNDENEE
jgi:MFS-type transporter involved in bile tolerance (Atg22 family)